MMTFIPLSKAKWHRSQGRQQVATHGLVLNFLTTPFLFRDKGVIPWWNTTCRAAYNCGPSLPLGFSYKPRNSGRLIGRPFLLCSVLVEAAGRARARGARGGRNRSQPTAVE